MTAEAKFGLKIEISDRVMSEVVKIFIVVASGVGLETCFGFIFGTCLDDLMSYNFFFSKEWSDVSLENLGFVLLALHDCVLVFNLAWCLCSIIS